jgi:hypothetical protein
MKCTVSIFHLRLKIKIAWGFPEILVVQFQTISQTETIFNISQGSWYAYLHGLNVVLLQLEVCLQPLRKQRTPSGRRLRRGCRRGKLGIDLSLSLRPAQVIIRGAEIQSSLVHSRLI